MCVNKVEILEVPDKPWAAVEKVLKDTKEKKKKPSLKKVVNNMPFIFTTYKAVHINERSISPIIISFKNMSSL